MADVVECSVPISLPASTVFDYVADARNQPVWCSGITSCRQIELDGPLPGAKYCVGHGKLMPLQRASLLLELVVVRPHHRLQWIRSETHVTATVDCYVDKLMDGTIVSCRETFDGIQEARLGALTLLMRRYRLPRDLWRLKQVLEERGP
jgi:hypothetical protein